MRLSYCLSLALIACTLSTNAQFWKVTEAQKLDVNVNSESEESIPVFHPDSVRLFFVRTFDKANKGDEYDQDIWYSEKVNGSFGESKQLNELDNKLNNAVLGFNLAGDRIYLLDSYGGKKDLVKGISYSDYVNGKWSAPVELLIPGLSIEGAFYGFHVNRTEDVIIISFNGPGSMGEEDLYVSLKENGSWSTPQHMGSSVNSAGYEISPFLSSTGDTLFFSSDGHGGLGSADIFYAVKNGSGWDSWSAPKALKAPFNSEGFDAYFTINNNQAFWSSDRGQENSDIYSAVVMKPPVLVANCIAQDVSKYGNCDGKVTVEIESGAGEYRFLWSNGEQSQAIDGLCVGDYSVTIYDGAGQTSKLTCAVTGPAQPLDTVIVKQFDNSEWIHYFNYNKNKLKLSNNSLKKFIKEIELQLEEGRDKITIVVNASASKVPTRSFDSNEELAQTRAENLKYDLITYFDKGEYKGKVTVVVGKTKVDGPEFENDSRNKRKYEPFQYVTLKTE